MDIQIMKLDKGYEDCRNLYSLLKVEGNDLLINIEKLVHDLSIHWNGSDAILHINNLIKVYNDLNFVFENGLNMIAETSDILTQMQGVRIKLGENRMIGDILTKEHSKKKLHNIQSTKGYYVSAELRNDAVLLKNILMKYKKIYNKFEIISKQLLNNWKIGPGREKIVSCYDNFNFAVATCNKRLYDVEDNINKVIINISKIEK